ncbi:MAG: hypothetical protein KA007_01130 [Candidatus Pacebacteria bacterium]|nr:hypothetical protein [Candidatus Paceibacterota bacterium]
MNLKDRIDKFNNRWNITSADSYEDAFNKFKTRILNIFNDIDSHVTEDSVAHFCQFYGIHEKWEHNYMGDHKWSRNMINRLIQESNEIEFYKLIEVIFSLDITQTGGHRYEVTYSKNILYKKVVEAVELSDVNLSIIATDGEVLLYPKGEDILDEELVNSPLSFFNKESAGHFIQALQFYQSKKHIKSAESLRRTLEEFLRYKLKNTKGLNANITELQTKLKLNGRNSQVRNILGSTFSYLDQYFNENSKHNDGDIDDLENEFLIYQTGLLLRCVNNL